MSWTRSVLCIFTSPHLGHRNSLVSIMNLEALPYSLDTMRIEDVPTVSEIEQIVFTLPWSSTAFAYELRNNASAQYHVLRYVPWVHRSWEDRVLPRSVRRFLPSHKSDQSLLGYGGFWLALEEAHICTLAMRPEWRGRGLGELLLASLVECAIEHHAELITLEVRVSNTTAQNLYQKYGFEIVGRRKGYYSDNGEDALIMTTETVTTPHYQQRFQMLTAELRDRLLTQSNRPPIAIAPLLDS
jgi:ribosomal-protein-alanine N-acetyltransferase